MQHPDDGVGRRCLWGQLLLNAVALKDRICTPCDEGGDRLDAATQQRLLRDLHADWRVVDAHHLERMFLFDDFKAALAFANAIGVLAEEAGHHPDLYIGWGKVRVQLWTHKMDGLHEADFILAARIDEAGAR